MDLTEVEIVDDEEGNKAGNKSELLQVRTFFVLRICNFEVDMFR